MLRLTLNRARFAQIGPGAGKRVNASPRIHPPEPEAFDRRTGGELAQVEVLGPVLTSPPQREQLLIAGDPVGPNDESGQEDAGRAVVEELRVPTRRVERGADQLLDLVS